MILLKTTSFGGQWGEGIWMERLMEFSNEKLKKNSIERSIMQPNEFFLKRKILV